MMPSEGGAARAQQLGALARLTHERATAEEIGGWLAELDGAELESSTATSCASRAATGSAPGGSRQSSPSSARAPAPTGRRAGELRARARRLRAFAPALERNVELARAYGECLAEEGARRLRGAARRLRLRPAHRGAARLFGALARALPPLVAEAQLALAAPHARGAGRRAARGRRGHAAAPRRGRRELAGGRLGASVHRVDRPARHAPDDALQRRRGRVAAQLAARVRPRAVRAPDRPGARAHQPRPRHLDVDPRVPEQAVGEPRRAQPRLRRGARRRAGRRRLRGRRRRAARHARGRRAVRRSASPPIRSPTRCTSSCASSSSSR